MELCIRGFASGKPFSDEHFVKIRCADRYVVAVTENGLGKIYTVGSDMLKYLHTVNVGGPKMVDCAVGDMFAVFINVGVF